MTTPQNVTERYASNLLHYGRNRDFDLIGVGEREMVTPEKVVVGRYFEARITEALRTKTFDAAGATPAQAVRRCLEKHGVTFR